MGKYPDFIESTGYGHVQGLCGANCRHSFGPYIEGLSPDTYTKAELNEFAAKTVTFTGADGNKKTVPYYDATQIQRQKERIIRELDRRVKVKMAAGTDATAEKAELTRERKKLAVFIAETGLRRDTKRERARKA